MANIGSVDRIIRFVLGVILLVAPFVPQTAGFFEGFGAWVYVVAAVGVVLIVTAALRICPAYMLFGIRTCPAQKA